LTKKEIFRRLYANLDPIRLREVILAIEGFKVSRTLVSPEDLHNFISLIETCGAYAAVYDRKYHYKEDWGKGGWVSRYGYEVSLEADYGNCMVYVANQPEQALQAMKREHSQQDVEFGDSLNIPPCCRKHYVRCIHLAESKQNDYLEYTLNNTATPYPHDPWTNVAAQYFGYCLLSFYPCSFTCVDAARHARQAYALLTEYSQDFADTFLEHHNMNYLYTEYDGIFQFPSSIYRDGVLEYEAGRMKSTLDSLLAAILRRGQRLHIEGKHHVIVSDRNGKTIGILDHEDLSILIFKG